MKTNLLKLREKIKKEKIDGLIISSVANIIHLTGYSNFSIHEREAYLLITENRQFILTDGRYQEAVKKQIPDFELVEISSGNPFTKILEDLNKRVNILSLGFEENNLTVMEYNAIKKVVGKLKATEVFEHRVIKDKFEISQIEKACELGDRTFEHILKKIRIDVSEKELAYEMECYIKKHGGDLSFDPIVAFGENSSVPHHQTGNEILKRVQDDSEVQDDNSDRVDRVKRGFANGGQIVLLDFGVKINNYCSDMTRTVFFGNPSKKQKKIYETVMGAQREAVEKLKIRGSGDIMGFEVDKAARDYILSRDYPSIPHSLGHGVGVEVHEHPFLSPKSKETLKNGMVFSIEPGIYIEEFGGVRIEDLFVLERNGVRRLNKSSNHLIVV